MARQNHSNKAIPAGATKAVVAAFLDEAGGDEGMASVALQLGVSMSRAYQLQDDATLTLDHAAVLTWNTKAPQAAEYLATLAGGQFVPVKPLDEDVSDLVARFAKEGGEVVQAAIAMLSRGDSACGVLASEIDDAIRVLIAARRSCTPNKKDRP